MKRSTSLLITALLFIAHENKAQFKDSVNFKSEKLTKTATITVNGKIDAVFPLFGAFEERKWAEGWNPTLIYPATEVIEEGTTFKLAGRWHNEKEILWRVSKYEPAKHLIQYLVSSENRYWTITVQCVPLANTQTTAEVTYTFIGLNESGNQINKHAIETMYKNNLMDWQEAINYYLDTGKQKPEDEAN